MYGSVAGISLVALPATLAFTGATPPGMALLAFIACAFLATGVAVLRASRHIIFQ